MYPVYCTWFVFRENVGSSSSSTKNISTQDTGSVHIVNWKLYAFYIQTIFVVFLLIQTREIKVSKKWTKCAISKDLQQYSLNLYLSKNKDDDVIMFEKDGLAFIHFFLGYKSVRQFKNKGTTPIICLDEGLIGTCESDMSLHKLVQLLVVLIQNNLYSIMYPRTFMCTLYCR